MNLDGKLADLALKAKSIKNSVATEEATKNAFVLPMLIVLGYDVYNPFEVIPEMDCDIANKGDKVDYAIKLDGKSAFIVECKQCSKNLDSFRLQLSKYYVATDAKIAILTNGLEYRFYADFNKTNLMDEKPFFVFDIIAYSDEDVELLGKFEKTAYNSCEILDFFKKRMFEDDVKKFIDNNVLSPKESFIKFVAEHMVSRGGDIDKIQNAVVSVMASISHTPIIEAKEVKLDIVETPKMDMEADHESPILNGEEYKVYLTVKDILSNYVDEGEIKYTSFKSYFTVNKWGSVWRWIIRFKNNNRGMSVCFPLDDYSRNEWVHIETVNDLYEMKDRLIKSLEIASFPSSRQDAVKYGKTANKPQIQDADFINI